jgi:hypothetical protein
MHAEPDVQALVGEPFRVVDVVVPGDPAAHGSRHAQPGQLRQPADRVQAQLLVAPPPRGRQAGTFAPAPRPGCQDAAGLPRLSHPLAALDPPDLNRAIATLLLGLDLVIVAVSGEQPDPTDALAADRPVAEDRAGYHLAVRQQPDSAAESDLPPRVLIADDAAAMRAALRGLLEDAGLPVIGEAARRVAGRHHGRTTPARRGGDGRAHARP